MPTAAEYLASARTLLDCYERLDGTSADAYCATPQRHAMAEGRYLGAISDLREAGVVSAPEFRDRVDRSCRRLERMAVVSTDAELAWGLGFPHGGRPSDEAYVITSATILRGACAASRAGADGRLAGIVRRAAKWLRSVDRIAVPGDGELRLPIYSKGIREPILNAVAMWAAALDESDRVQGKAISVGIPDVAEWLAAQYLPELGWPYAPEQPKYDLVHEAYILNALLALQTAFPVERAAMEVLAGFRSGGAWLDKFDIADLPEAIESATRSGSVSLGFRGGRTLVQSSKPARLWAIGAVLELIGRLALRGGQPYWRTQIRRFPADRALAVSDDPIPERHDFRQEMHLAHGLAAAFLALRRAPA